MPAADSEHKIQASDQHSKNIKIETVHYITFNFFFRANVKKVLKCVLSAIGNLLHNKFANQFLDAPLRNTNKAVRLSEIMCK